MSSGSVVGIAANVSSPIKISEPKNLVYYYVRFSTMRLLISPDWNKISSIEKWRCKRLGSARARGYPIAMAPYLAAIPIPNPIPNPTLALEV